MDFTFSLVTINLNSTNNPIHKSLLKDFLQNHDVDIAFLQEVAYENFTFVPSYTAIVNISPEKVGTAILLRKNLQFDHPILDPSGRIISVIVHGINFVNIYAYSGTNKKKLRDEFFRSDIVVHLAKSKCELSVIGGDFNCILDKADSNSAVKNFCSGLSSLVDQCHFKDVMKELKTTEFTFLRGESSSRLDRFYAPEAFIKRVSKGKTIATAFSDHRAVFLKIKMLQQDLNCRGRGYWKINPVLINNEQIIERFKHEYERLKLRHIFQTDLSSWWNYAFKAKVRSFFKGESFRMNQRIEAEKGSLYAELQNLTDRQAQGENCNTQICLTKSKLMEIEQQRLKNYELKMNDSTIANGERQSIFQISKQYQSSEAARSLNRSKTSDGMLRQVHEHFSNLFSNNDEIISVAGSNPLDNVSKSMTRDESEELMRDITEGELLVTLKQCTRKKSPGPDGLSYEFYIECFDIVKNELLTVLNSYLKGTATPPKEFSAGIVVMIPKKGDLSDLNNHRPISMLNTDYKLLMKILANRLSTIVETLLGPGQTAVVGGRSCTDNLKDIRRIVTRAIESKSFKGFLLTVDLEKAFDKVNHSWLWKVLEKFSFPDGFITILKKLYGQASSRVLWNGFLTSEIPIKCSVRQGCPLSMILFALYIEPLIRQIQDSGCGILVYGKFLKVIAFADDLNIFIKSQEEFDLIMDILMCYSKYTKIKLNLEKSSFLRFNQAKSGPQLIQEKDEMKVLGVQISNSWSKMIDTNYGKLIRDINFLLKIHGVRNLNIYEKSWLLNSMILSKLWYIAQILPPKNKHLAMIKQAVGKFLWKGHIFKVARDQLYLDYDKGGIKLIDPESQCKALFIKNILYRSDGNDNVDESYLLRYNKLNQLTRNAKEWVKCAIEIKSRYDLKTVRLLYWSFIDKKSISVDVETRFPNVEWNVIWRNLGLNFLLSADKEIVYKLVNDIVPNKEKLLAYNIGNLNGDYCEHCGVSDSNMHRIRECRNSQEVRQWTKQILKERIMVQYEKIEDILQWNINVKNKQHNAALWLAMHCIAWCITGEANNSLYCFKKSIREFRWLNKTMCAMKFGNFLNIC